MIKSNDRRRLTLVRNPHFREWSNAAQPDGYPDRIVWRSGIPENAALRLVEQGRSDWSGAVSPARLAEVRTRYASQLHSNPRWETTSVFLDTSKAPFDDVRVRRAVNLAVDRGRVIEHLGGPDFAQPACQVLPPNFPGYRRYCPYTAGASRTGAWRAPDLAGARRLVEASGTRGAAVSLWTPAVMEEQASEVVLALRRLGYRVRLKVFPDIGKYFAAIGDPRRKGVQAGGNGWVADYPSPLGFIEPQLTCASRSAGGANVGRFCNPKIDGMIERARTLQLTDPQAANALWARIDCAITDEAPWVVLANERQVDFVSRRVGNYQFSPQWGMLLSQVWVR
jgi:peptide/nickel transport system substrate-binding protein